MAKYSLFIKTVTELINERLGSNNNNNNNNNNNKIISSKTVEELFHFKMMDQSSLTRLVNNLANETRKFNNALKLDLNEDDDELAVKQMVELGLVSFNWRERDTVGKLMVDFATKYYQKREQDQENNVAAAAADADADADADAAAELSNNYIF